MSTPEGEKPAQNSTLYDADWKTNHTTHIVSFHDENALESVTLTGTENLTKLGVDDSSNLAQFLARPVKLSEYSWPIGTTFDQDLVPMDVLLSKTAIAKKIANFRNLHGKLCLKIVMNGNPFYYGRLVVNWQPFVESTSHHSSSIVRHDLMQKTQRMHIMMNPAMSEPAVMYIPFYFPRQSLNLLQGSDAVQFGTLNLTALNQLGHANGSTTAINVSVFGWIENVEVGAPTTQLSSIHPSADERDGKVYKIASKTAKAANMFSSTPVIGAYASALEKSADITAKFAKLFGWSKPERDYGTNMVPYVTDDFATTDGLDNVRRLVADTKQGLTIDPRTVGLPGDDELAVNKFVTHRSYFNTVNWTSTDDAGTFKFGTVIDPGINAFDVASNAHQYTPMGVPALAHKFWTGSIRVRIEIACSSYHKGRLLILYDPENMPISDPETNTTYSHIMDISECTEMSFDIGWGQNAPFRRVVGPVYAETITPNMSSVSYGNGYLAIYVLNDLVGPMSASDCYVNVYVQGCDDLRFANPSGDYIPRIALDPPPEPYITASASAESSIVKFQPSVVPPNIFHEHFGETTMSLRALMKRYSFYAAHPSVVPAATASDDFVTSTLTWANYPAFLTIESTANPPNPLAVEISPGVWFSNNATTLLTFVGSCFAGARGGVRWAVNQKLMARGGSDNYYGTHQFHGFVGRTNDSTESYTVTTGPVTEANLASRSYIINGWAADSLNGKQVTDVNINPLTKVEIPFYSNLRFTQCNLAKNAAENNSIAVSESQSGLVAHARFIDDIAAEHIGLQTIVHVSVGEDFSFLWFQCVPEIYFSNIGAQ